MTPIKLRHSDAPSVVGFTASILIFATMVLGGDVYFGSFDNDGGQWALVNNASDEPTGFHFIGFVPARRQLIVGSPYYYDVVDGHFWEFGPPAFEGKISGTGEVNGTAKFGAALSGLGNREFPPPYSDLSFSGAIDVSDGSVSRFLGSWSWSNETGPGPSANAVTSVTIFGRYAHAFVGPTGKALLFVQDAGQGGADCGVGSIDDEGNLNVSFAFGNRALARIDPETRKLVVEFQPPPTKAAPEVATPTSRLVNFSVRANLITASARLTAGFARRGVDQPVLIRAIGPGLRPFLATGSLVEDSQVVVYGSSGAQLDANDDWGSRPDLPAAFDAAGSFPLRIGSKDAAVLAHLSGSSVVRFSGTTAGVGLLEIFDLGPDNDSRFISFEVPYFAGGPSGDLIAGFAVVGTGPKTVLVRGLGPRLLEAPFNYGNYWGDIGDPIVSVHRADGSIVAMNDDWSSDLSPIFLQVGAASLTPGSNDSALLLELPPGTYTVLLRNALITRPTLLEIFEVP